MKKKLTSAEETMRAVRRFSRRSFLKSAGAAGSILAARLSGRGPALVVVPDGRTPLEAYKPILTPPRGTTTVPVFTDPTPRSVTAAGVPLAK